MTALFNFALSIAQRAVLRMIKQRGGAVRMNISEQAIGQAGIAGLQTMRNLGLISITPLVGTSEHDVRLTSLGTSIVVRIMDHLQ